MKVDWFSFDKFHLSFLHGKSNSFYCNAMSFLVHWDVLMYYVMIQSFLLYYSFLQWRRNSFLSWFCFGLLHRDSIYLMKGALISFSFCHRCEVKSWMWLYKLDWKKPVFKSLISILLCLLIGLKWLEKGAFINVFALFQ